MDDNILGPNQLKWLEALESGKYEQGVGCLNKDNRLCCLGVGCEALGVERRAVKEGFVSYGELAAVIEAPDER